MGSIFQFNENQLLAFILVLIRVSTFLGLWPILGGQTIPRNSKILFSVAFTIVVFPLVGWNQIQGLLETNFIIWLALKEVVIGLIIVAMTQLLLFTVNICGQIVSTSMGLASASIFNPAQGQQANVLEQVQVLMCSVFFLAINGHHLFIDGLVQSFNLVPLGMEGINAINASDLILMTQEVMLIGVKLSAPIMASIFVMNLAMAVVGRAVPQINILITSFPVNILFGFMVLIVTVPMFLNSFKISIDTISNFLFMTLKTL